MKSTMFSLKTRDFIKALVVAVITPVLTIIVTSATAGSLVFDWKAIVTTAVAAGGAYLLKNLFTDDTKVAEKIVSEEGGKVVPKDAKVISVLLALLAFSFCGNAQSKTNFFKPIGKIKANTVSRSAVALPSAGTTFWALRPTVVAVTIFGAGTAKAAAGAGFSYQQITQDADANNYVNLAISLVALAGGSVVPDKPTDIGSLGLFVAFLNGTVGVGAAVGNTYNPVTLKHDLKPGLMVSWNFNFNNGPSK